MLQEAQDSATTNLVPEGASVLLRSIHPINLLSFGPDTPEIPLGPLNVLVGANGSGKSNLIEIVCLLRSTSRSNEDFLIDSGGFNEWIHRSAESLTEANISARVIAGGAVTAYNHFISFFRFRTDYVIDAETIVRLTTDTNPTAEKILLDYDHGLMSLHINGETIELSRDFILDNKESLLLQFRNPVQYRDMNHIASSYERIQTYREWSFGRNTIFRTPQRADMRTDRLEEDFSNLGLFLNKLRRNPQAKNAILTRLRDLYEGVDDYDVSIEGGTVQVFLTEGNITVPATRLSDGTLRYLCLLAILCDPTPPPLICLEEPELGLHPDILPKIADLLVEASTRTQLIVTTHSDIIIDALTDRPESVLVCEKHDGQTQIKRLSRDDLGEWLKTYRLGELWTRGEIGGTRW